MYDYMGRRVRKNVFDYAGGWPADDNPDERWHFVYEGWNVVMMLDGMDGPDPGTEPDNTIVRKYTWGLDLSGTIHGAAGIGGLLAAFIPGGEPDDVTLWYFYDANGNVGQVLDATSLQTIGIGARYEYDPYGTPIPIPQPPGPGPYADLNSFRFSTKWFDEETGLGYWGYRYYSPRLGRWLSRDPIGESGGLNLLAFVANQSINRYDMAGLDTATAGRCGCSWEDLGYRDSSHPLYLKLIGVLYMRHMQVVPWFWDLFWKEGELYAFNDELHELRKDRKIRTKMNQFYRTYLDGLSLRGGWYTVEIPFQSAQAKVGPFSMDCKVFGDTGFWLNGAHDVRVHGSVEVCREGDKYLFRNLCAKWQWHDEIDGRSYRELYRDQAPWYSIIIEGSYDVVFDKIRDLDYYAIIHFTDEASQGEFPPGVQ